MNQFINCRNCQLKVKATDFHSLICIISSKTTSSIILQTIFNRHLIKPGNKTEGDSALNLCRNKIGNE